MRRPSDLYTLPLDGARFATATACGGNTHPDGESCVTLARLGDDAWALGDSKRPRPNRCGSPPRS